MSEPTCKTDERKTLSGDGTIPAAEKEYLPNILPKRRCEHPLAAQIERQLAQNIAAHETFDDDKVVPEFFSVNFSITVNFLGQKQKRIFAGQR
jgi:hypothetical protein